ncbi:hypothetical protein NE237_018961 [Protea cynaroides]|uniref:F-box domain-containing protein n=1 Tax=Protea cynaroides TaxID=273540 RepID=A0A9Q0KAW4_9MAGN|nr:hypothetical protein NE237_018961 [Protea cynaroides]
MQIGPNMFDSMKVLYRGKKIQLENVIHAPCDMDVQQEQETEVVDLEEDKELKKQALLVSPLLLIMEEETSWITNCFDDIGWKFTDTSEFESFSEISDEGDNVNPVISIDFLLPDDLLERILAYLPILRVGCVCKRWNEIVNSIRLNVLSQKPWYFMFTSSDEPIGGDLLGVKEEDFEHNDPHRTNIESSSNGQRHECLYNAKASIVPTATFGIDHDTKSGYEMAPVSRSTTLRRSASNRNGPGDALAARARRREEAALDRTKSGAHKALRGLRFINLVLSLRVDMADGTKLRMLDDAIKLLSESSTTKNQRLDAFQATQIEQQCILSELILKIATIDGSLEQAIHMAPSSSLVELPNQAATTGFQDLGPNQAATTRFQDSGSDANSKPEFTTTIH